MNDNQPQKIQPLTASAADAARIVTPKDNFRGPLTPVSEREPTARTTPSAAKGDDEVMSQPPADAAKTAPATDGLGKAKT